MRPRRRIGDTSGGCDLGQPAAGKQAGKHARLAPGELEGGSHQSRCICHLRRADKYGGDCLGLKPRADRAAIVDRF